MWENTTYYSARILGIDRSHANLVAIGHSWWQQLKYYDMGTNCSPGQSKFIVVTDHSIGKL